MALVVVRLSICSKRQEPSISLPPRDSEECSTPSRPVGIITLQQARAQTGRFEREETRRLRVSKIDLMQLHSVSWSWQNVGPLRDWKAQGLVRYIGITKDSSLLNFDTVEDIMRRWRPDFIQVDYSLNNRAAEERLLPAAAELGVAVLTNEPFGGVRRGGAPSGHNLFRAVRGKPLPDWASEFDAATWGQFFLKYLLGNPAVTAVIPGTDKPAHMADNLGAGRGRPPNAAQRQRMVQFIEALA